MKYYLIILICLLFLSCTAQTTEPEIRINQVGFLPESKKLGIIVESDATEFKIFNDSNFEVYAGTLTSSSFWSNADENVKVANFSDFNRHGTFYIKVEGVEDSYPFTISDDVLNDLSKASLKSFYYSRVSMELTSEFAGEYARPLGHPDDEVVIHATAASTERPAGTILSSPYGWYDAGDYNKYIVNSGISTYTILSAYEKYAEYYDTLALNIPESANDIPDILDEAYWNLKWMTTMQDPNDGGVYHKLTHANFQGFFMPHQITETRYLAAKSTAATLDFAAVMAQASRVYEPYMPDFATVCLEMSKEAWEWAKSNPFLTFTNPRAENGYPAIVTGEYGDGNLSDEFFWAASELFITTLDEQYGAEIDLNTNFDIPGWPNVKTLGLLSLVTHREDIGSSIAISDLENTITNLADNIVDFRNNSSPYNIGFDSFYWGSNSLPLNQNLILSSAFELQKERKYFDVMVDNLDYVSGRNATDFCFITGFGSNNPKNLHHRPSAADGIAEPIPGFIAGGPNPQNTDDCGISSYPTTLPAKSYVDLECSYATNEIAINWNAPLVYTMGAVEHIYHANYKVAQVTGFNNIKENEKFKVIYRKGSDNIKISFNNPTFANGEASLFTMDGKKVKFFSSTPEGFSTNVANVVKGMYLIVISSGYNSRSKKIFIH